MSLELSSPEKVERATALRLELARRRGVYPLSYAQSRLWMFDRSDPGNPAYDVSRAFRILGPLDVGALDAAVRDLVRRHASLRTVVRFDGDGPVQVVLEPPSETLRIVDLRDLTRTDARTAATRIRGEAASARFDLERDLMLRAKLVRLADDEHELILTMHHIAVDERSLEIAYADIARAYDARRRGREPSFAPLPLSYAEFAVRERASCATASVRKQLAYWTAHLADLPASPTPPHARARPARPRFVGASLGFSLDPARTAALRAIARSVGATPFAAYLAAFYASLAVYAEGTDLVVGTPMSGRRLPGADAIVGFFANAAALRLDASGDPRFLELVARVQAVVLAAFEHAEVPFERVVADVATERVGATHPLFQVAFAMQSDVEASFALAGLAVAPVAVPRASAKFDLTALVGERDGGLDVELNYDVDLFDGATIAELRDRFAKVLETVAARPELRLSAFATPTHVAPTRSIETTPAPERERIDDAVAADIEARLGALWTSLLGRHAIGVDEDFFALGGHSLLAIRLIAKVEASFGIRVSMAEFFERPTIAGLARALHPDRARGARAAMEVVGRSSLRKPIVFFYGDLQGVAVHARAIATEIGDRAVHLLAPHGTDGTPVPETFEAMASQYVELLRSHEIHPPYDLVGYCSGGIVALEVARQIAATGVAPPHVLVVETDIGSRTFDRIGAIVRRVGTLARCSKAVRVRAILAGAHRARALERGGGRVALRLVVADLRTLATRRRARAAAEETAERIDLLRIYRERFLDYRARPYSGRITIFATTTERLASPDRVAKWRALCARARFVTIAGDHISCFTKEGGALARALRDTLDD